MNALPRRLFSEEEYLMVEDLAEIRSQFVSGELFTMDGEQPWHCDVAGNIMMSLHGQFRARLDGHVYSSQMRVRVSAGELLTYPDVCALAGEPRFEHLPNSANLLNPQVIVEVLSPFTEVFDCGDKFRCYRRLESLTDYVLASPERMWVEHRARRQDGSILITEYRQPDDRILLTSVNAELRLADIYDRVEFPPPERRPKLLSRRSVV